MFSMHITNLMKQSSPVNQPVTKFIAFYQTWRFITMFYKDYKSCIQQVSPTLNPYTNFMD